MGKNRFGLAAILGPEWNGFDLIEKKPVLRRNFINLCYMDDLLSFFWVIPRSIVSRDG
ncbi:hypothetical protein [Methylomonas albis]|nr:hypothetical protein [Methylomonas albis]